ncbi:class I SAM-dependent methyltransferase [Sorangium sp. So ce362]|uniref:class I SAM-dependent methyltransferase n=1 Tax=Sorangium sp. So ce362 TaxID=3133303 RepID=UPI003F617E0E
MRGFAVEWLALREPVDQRSRSGDLSSALAARLGARAQISVVDLGAGTGSNLRATAPLLGPEQRWTLVDHDGALLAAARAALTQWAETTVEDGEPLVVEKAGRRITVSFQRADLAADLPAALGRAPDLVTASALFDLVSPERIVHFAAQAAARRAVCYVALTYNGVQRWSPSHPADSAMAAAFHRHQRTDKGFGAAAGPAAPQHLAEQLRRRGYEVLEGDSPWVLGAADAALLGELQSGFAQAVSDVGTLDALDALDARTLDAWSRLRRTGGVVGHTDLLAFPP